MGHLYLFHLLKRLGLQLNDGVRVTNTADHNQTVHTSQKHLCTKVTPDFHLTYSNQRTNGPVNAHLISCPSEAQNIQKPGKYMVKK